MLHHNLLGTELHPPLPKAGLNPLGPNISIYIPHTLLRTFLWY